MPHEVLVMRISLEMGKMGTWPSLKTSITSTEVRVREPKVSVHSTFPRMATPNDKELLRTLG